jgi:hypothetical protein
VKTHLLDAHLRLEDRTTPNVAYALDAGGTALLSFDTATPDTVTTKAISGLVVGDVLAGIDFRPFDGQLYALGFNDGANTGRLYRLDAGTGAATQVGASTFTLNGSFFGFDFNPVADRIRVVSETGENLRVNPNDGTLAGTDTNLSTLNVVGAAYDRNLNARPNATTAPPAGTLTTLFGIEGGPTSWCASAALTGRRRPTAGWSPTSGPWAWTPPAACSASTLWARTRRSPR